MSSPTSEAVPERCSPRSCAPIPAGVGILFDQPAVVTGAADVLADAGVADRVEIVGGSFFDHVPGGADAYVLRRILHDWLDPEGVRILRQIRRVIPDDGRLLVIDGIVGPPNEDPLVKFLDLMMLISAGGKERTGDEWSELLAAGGFRLHRAYPWLRQQPRDRGDTRLID